MLDLNGQRSSAVLLARFAEEVNENQPLLIGEVVEVPIRGEIVLEGKPDRIFILLRPFVVLFPVAEFDSDAVAQDVPP